MQKTWNKIGLSIVFNTLSLNEQRQGKCNLPKTSNAKKMFMSEIKNKIVYAKTIEQKMDHPK